MKRQPVPSVCSILVLTLIVPPCIAQADDVFDSNGVKIRYVTEGSGEAVVLIHGWMGDSSTWGRDLRGNTRLKGMTGFQAIAIDCRGHGQSDKPHEIGKYGPELAMDVVRLLDHLKIEKTHLIGYSSGAFIAGKVAAMHPERILSIVYAGQAPLLTPPKGEAEAAEAEPASGPSEVEVFARLVEEGRDLGEYILAVTPTDRMKLTAAQAKVLAKVMFDGKDLHALSAAGRSFGTLAVAEEDLRKCKAPTLFLHGSEESAAVKTRVAAVHARLGHGTIELVEGGDHVTTLAKPAFGNALKNFLRANQQRQDGK